MKFNKMLKFIINGAFACLGMVYFILAGSLLIMTLYPSKIIEKTIFYAVIYIFISVITIFFRDYFSFFSKIFILLSVALCPIFIFLAGYFNCDDRFYNPIVALRFLPFTLSILPTLILVVFSTSLIFKLKPLNLFKLISCISIYGLSIFCFFCMYRINKNPYFLWALFLQIPAYLSFNAIYLLIAKIRRSYH